LNRRRLPGRAKWLLPAGLAFVVGAVWGSGAVPWSATARAEVREETSREHFLSGSERSEIVLKDIAGILSRIEERVARIEESLSEDRPAAARGRARQPVQGP
jgi:hypothetical protein